MQQRPTVKAPIDVSAMRGTAAIIYNVQQSVTLLNEQSDLALIGSRIKAVRTGKGMSQADLAVKASVSLPLISNIERGKTRMQLETFVKVAEALQVSADHLLRADVPEVKTIYQGEFAELLEDCSASEMETILNIVREVKASMHKKQNMD